MGVATIQHIQQRDSYAEGIRRLRDTSQRIHQQIQSGVELLGVASTSADVELMRLLLAAAGTLGLQPLHKPCLLVGHHGLLEALLAALPEGSRAGARAAITGYDPLALAALDLAPEQRTQLLELIRLRGQPTIVLERLRGWLGATPLLEQLADTLAVVAPAAKRLGVELQLDPSFQPHFALYDGLVLKLVCQGAFAPVEIASGGRYDALVGRFCSAEAMLSGEAAGVGFGFDVESVRDLLNSAPFEAGRLAEAPVLVAYGATALLGKAIDQLEQLHAEAITAELLSSPAGSQADAVRIGLARGCSRTIWVDS